MASVTYKVSELLKSGATVYKAPLGTTLPAPELAIGAAWPLGWESLGLTDVATMVAMELESVVKDNLQQVPGAAEVGYVSTGVTLETGLAQVMNVDVLQHASAGLGTVTKVPAGVGTVGYEQFDFGGKVGCATPYMYGLEGTHCNETGLMFPIRAYVWRGAQTEGWELGLDRTDYTAGLKLMIRGTHDLSRAVGSQLFRWIRVTAAATS